MHILLAYTGLTLTILSFTIAMIQRHADNRRLYLLYTGFMLILFSIVLATTDIIKNFSLYMHLAYYAISLSFCCFVYISISAWNIICSLKELRVHVPIEEDSDTDTILYYASVMLYRSWLVAHIAGAGFLLSVCIAIWLFIL